MIFKVLGDQNWNSVQDFVLDNDPPIHCLILKCFHNSFICEYLTVSVVQPVSRWSSKTNLSLLKAIKISKTFLFFVRSDVDDSKSDSPDAVAAEPTVSW